MTETEFENGYARAIALMRYRLKGSSSGVIERELILKWLDNMEKRRWKNWTGRFKKKK